jgi:hypothetical protein
MQLRKTWARNWCVADYSSGSVCKALLTGFTQTHALSAAAHTHRVLIFCILPCRMSADPSSTALQVDAHQDTGAVPASSAFQGSSRLEECRTTPGQSASPVGCTLRHHRELSARHTASARPGTVRLTQACPCGNTSATSAPSELSTPARELATATSPRSTATTMAGSSTCRARRHAVLAMPRTPTVASARLTWALLHRPSVCAHLGLVGQSATRARR